MFSYAAPSGIVFMQPQDLFTIAAHPGTFQGAYAINAAASTAQYTAILTPSQPPQSAAATLIDANHQFLLPQIPISYSNSRNTHHYSTASTVAPTDSSFSFVTAHNSNNNNNNNSRGYASHISPAMRRTRSGHVSKSKVGKRNATDLTKVCPSCSKQWRLCNCSNVKNRPAPKPYCKFVPPRMQQSKKN